MKKHNPSKFIALAMACTLLVTPLTALGAEGDADSSVSGNTVPGTTVSVSGNGQVEGIVNKEVYCVVLPTQDENADTFNFILDPQDLISKTNHEAYDNISSVSGNQLYFTKGDELSGTSETLTVLNKSSVDVDVTVSATIGGLSDGADDPAYEISLAESDTFDEDDDSTSIYLGLNVDADAPVVLTADEGASVTKTLAGADDKYSEKYVGEPGKKYDFVLDEPDADDFAKLEFSLSGACNTNADWADAKDAVPSINLVWGFDKAAQGPQVTLSKTGLITVSGLTDELNYKTATFKGVTKSSEFNFATKGAGTLNLYDWSKTDAGSGKFTFQLSDTFLNSYKNAKDTVTVTITLTDGSTIQARTTFN